MYRLGAFFILALLSGSVFADQRGRFLCTTGCGSELNGGGSAVIANGETRMFISEVVNPIVFGPGAVPDDRWRPGDTVAVCDGTTCWTYMYQALGAFVQILVSEDPGTLYRNSGSNGGVGGGVGGGGGNPFDGCYTTVIESCFYVGPTFLGCQQDSVLECGMG